MTHEVAKPSAIAGFTLLELLVGLVVLGFLMLGLAQGMRLAAEAYERQGRIANVVGELDATDRALRQLIEQIDPSADAGKPWLDGGEHVMRFITALPLAAGGLQMRQADVLLYVDSAHRLMLRWVPWQRDGRLSPTPVPTETVLLERVDRVNFFYLGSGPRAAWTTTWSGIGLPALVRLHIAFPAGDNRRWPDIVVVPMRDGLPYG
jgi:general secretion pathway protein J